MIYIYVTVTYLSMTNVITVKIIATNDTATPTYPMMFRLKVTPSESCCGLALNKMAKWVR